MESKFINLINERNPKEREYKEKGWGGAYRDVSAGGYDEERVGLGVIEGRDAKMVGQATAPLAGGDVGVDDVQHLHLSSISQLVF